MTWQNVKLGDVCDVRDGTHDSPKYIENGFPLITSKNLVNGFIDKSNTNYISEADYTKICKRSKVDFGDILMPMIGTIGNPVVVDEVSPAFAIKNVALIKFNDQLTDRFFIKSVLQSQLFNSYVQNVSRGGTQKFLSLGDIRKFLFPLPPLAEQKRIAAILDKADEIRRKREQTIAKLDQLAQSIFVEMFGDAIHSNVRIELSELIGEFRYGTSNKSGAFGYPTLRIPNVAYGSLDLSELKTVQVTEEEFKRLKLIEGDLLFVRTNGNPEYVGRCVVFNPVDVANTGFDASKYIYASYLIRARLKSSSVLPIVIQEFLSTVEGKQALKARCKTSAGQFNINTEGLGSLPIPNFPMSFQKSFIAIKKSIDQQKIVHQKALTQQTQLFASLQHQAFTGNL
jgi:type I restriction enzyme S subunit